MADRRFDVGLDSADKAAQRQMWDSWWYDRFAIPADALPAPRAGDIVWDPYIEEVTIAYGRNAFVNFPTMIYTKDKRPHPNQITRGNSSCRSKRCGRSRSAPAMPRPGASGRSNGCCTRRSASSSWSGFF
jgi:hypothetical protein